MNTTEINKAALQLLRQYRDIPSLDKSRDMLVAKYGEKDYLAIRKAFAVLWLQQQKGLSIEPSPIKPADAPKKQETRKVKGTRKPVQTSVKTKTVYRKNIVTRISSSALINGVRVNYETPDYDVAHLMLLEYGSPENIRKHSEELCEKLTEKRYEKVLTHVYELFSHDEESYRARYDKKLQRRKQRKTNALKNRSEKIQKEKERIALQNKKWAEDQARPKKGSENYFKLIYIAAGNKR